MSCSLPCPLGNSAGGRIPAGVQCLLSEGRYSPESIPHCGLTTAPAPPPSTSFLLRQSPPQPLVPLRAEPPQPWVPAQGRASGAPSGWAAPSPGAWTGLCRQCCRARNICLTRHVQLGAGPGATSSLMFPRSLSRSRLPGARLCLALCGL